MKGIKSNMKSEKMHDMLSQVYSYMIQDHHGDWGMDIHQWDWVPGVGIIAIADYGSKLKQENVIRYVLEWVEMNKMKSEVKKTINSMAPFAVFPDLYRATQHSWFLEKSQEIVSWMIDEAPRTREGAFEHTVTENVEFQEQVWADTIYMAVLFLARYAGLTQDRRVAEEALQQTMLHLRLLQNPETGLLFHGWNCEAGNHMSATQWNRANAWIMIAVPEIVTELRGIIEIPDELMLRYSKLAMALCKCQAEDGLWHTVLDRQDFYKETSGSAGIACGFIKAVKAGMLDNSYLALSRLTLETVLSLITSKGEVTGVSGGTAVKPTIEDYNRVRICPTLYGQGLVMQLLIESLLIEEV
jgi:unsaturated rhamnogalacturonyl hydrolase